jgi:hypothetical protein
VPDFSKKERIKIDPRIGSSAGDVGLFGTGFLRFFLLSRSLLVCMVSGFSWTEAQAQHFSILRYLKADSVSVSQSELEVAEVDLFGVETGTCFAKTWICPSLGMSRTQMELRYSWVKNGVNLVPVTVESRAHEINLTAGMWWKNSPLLQNWGVSVGTVPSVSFGRALFRPSLKDSSNIYLTSQSSWVRGWGFMGKLHVQTPWRVFLSAELGYQQSQTTFGGSRLTSTFLPWGVGIGFNTQSNSLSLN